MWAASAGASPKAACSRKRRAAEEETCGFGTPIGTTKGCETTGPFATVRLAELAGPANPEIVIVLALPKTVVRLKPPNVAIEDAVKPAPDTEVEKTPKGSGEVPRDEIAGATLLTSVTVALLCPVAVFGVTVSVRGATGQTSATVTLVSNV